MYVVMDFFPPTALPAPPFFIFDSFFISLTAKVREEGKSREAKMNLMNLMNLLV